MNQRIAGSVCKLQCIEQSSGSANHAVSDTKRYDREVVRRRGGVAARRRMWRRSDEMFF